MRAKPILTLSLIASALALSGTAAALGLTGTEQRLLPGLGTGQGLWRIKDRSFVVQHQLHPVELAAFDTTARMTGETARSSPDS